MKNKKLKFKREYSAGGVVYKKLQVTTPKDGQASSKPQVKWLIGKHSGYHKWVLPKGLIEEGERGYETALREVEEEMGVKGKLVSEKPLHKEEYWFVAELKSKESIIGEKSKKTIRRVGIYQENMDNKEKQGAVRVLKTVSFYLMEYKSGNPESHDWEMEEAA